MIISPKNILVKVLSKYKWILLSLLFISIITPFVANDTPIICSTKDGIILPIFNKQKYNALRLSNSIGHQCKWSINPPIPFHAKSIHPEDRLLPPLSGYHILGTDSLGRDIFAGMLYGLRMALLVALVSMLIAAFGGVLLGSVAGYFGNSFLKISKTELFFHSSIGTVWIFICAGWIQYYSEYSVFIILILLIIWLCLHYFIYKIMSFKNRNMPIPLDNIIMRSIEIYKSIPALFILLIILGFIGQSAIITLSMIIGLLSIPNITRIVRGEILKIKENDFVNSSIILNQSHSKILFQQILPNLVGPLSVALSFGAAGAILIEATLSFLGIGLALDEVTWGSILTESRNYHMAWWLALAPGAGIFGTILLFNNIGNFISSSFRSQTTGL